MKIITTKCPNCSADLEVAPEQMKVHCPYCGSSLLIESDLSDIAEKEKKQAKIEAKADKKRSKQQDKIEKKKLKKEQKLQ